MYGLSLKQDTKELIAIAQESYCEACSKADLYNLGQWCKQCQISYLKKNFTNWTSGNEKIDGFIQEMQLSINYYKWDILFEWVPYDQFDNIKEIGKSHYATMYSA